MFREQRRHPRRQAVIIFAGFGILTTLLRTLVLPYHAADTLPLFDPFAAALRLLVSGVAFTTVWWATRESPKTRLEFPVLITIGLAYSIWAIWYDRPAAVLMVVPIVLRTWIGQRPGLVSFAVLTLASLLIYLAIPPLATFPSWAEWEGLLQLIVLTVIQGGFAYAAFELMVSRNEERQHLNRVLAQLEAAQDTHLHNVALQERAFLSRELHDTIGHHITALNLHTQRAQLLLAQGHVAQMSGALQEIDRRGQDVVQSLQEVVLTMKGNPPISLGTALETLVDRWPGEVKLDLPDRQLDLPPPLSFALLRCCQEALTNVQKHAPGAQATMRLWLDGSAIHLCVKNPVPQTGARRVGSGGHGLLGVQARVKALGGTLEARRLEGCYVLNVSLPLST